MRHIPISGVMPYPLGTHINMAMRYIEDMKNILVDLYGDHSITLWCRGSSGAIIAALVSTGFRNCSINHVKKEGEPSHSKNRYRIIGKQVIIDDFIDSSATVNAIYDDMVLAKSWEHNSMLETADVKVDCLAVFQTVAPHKLKFDPDVIICGHIRQPLPRVSPVVNDLLQDDISF